MNWYQLAFWVLLAVSAVTWVNFRLKIWVARQVWQAQARPGTRTVDIRRVAGPPPPSVPPMTSLPPGRPAPRPLATYRWPCGCLGHINRRCPAHQAMADVEAPRHSGGPA